MHTVIPGVSRELEPKFIDQFFLFLFHQGGIDSSRYDLPRGPSRKLHRPFFPETDYAPRYYPSHYAPRPFPKQRLTWFPSWPEFERPLKPYPVRPRLRAPYEYPRAGSLYVSPRVRRPLPRHIGNRNAYRPYERYFARSGERD